MLIEKELIKMEKKFVLTEETRVVKNKTLYRIKAEKNFGKVKKGELGGFVEKEENLSHGGKAWISGNACVYGDAKVSGNAKICGIACVFENAHIHDNAYICGEAKVYGNANIYDFAVISDRASVYGDVRIHDQASVRGQAWVCGHAHIYHNARIYDNACISGNVNVFSFSSVHGNAKVYDNVRIHDNACICGNACISGNAIIYENACVFGDALVRGNACICEQAYVQFSRLDTDLREDLKASLRCQCNLIPENDKVIAYKIVYDNLHSLYDNKFVYEVGEIAVCENPREDNSSCAEGLHFSNLTYWDNRADEFLSELVYLKAEIDLEDIITVQEGKIRCRKAKILSKIDII
jgi:carbonic anhydrase/acetyltransferase-like protein (isoleucine patch superfamily)